MKSKLVPALLAAALLVACSGGSNNSSPAPLNEAPTLSAIADFETPANQPGAPLTFSVDDEDVDSLDISATSENEAVIASDGIRLQGSGQSRVLTVTPQTDTTGSVLITVTAIDNQGLSAQTRFRVIVTPLPQSLDQFLRETFLLSADSEPVPINALEFSDDIDTDVFPTL